MTQWRRADTIVATHPPPFIDTVIYELKKEIYNEQKRE